MTDQFDFREVAPAVALSAPALHTRVAAAYFAVAFGVERTGRRTLVQLMHPVLQFSADDVRRVAAKTLASAQAVALAALPESDRCQIETEIKQYLDDCFLGSPQSDKNHFVTLEHPQY